MTNSDDDDELYRLDALLEFAASDERGRRVYDLAAPVALRKLLARVAWTRRPVIRLYYNGGVDELIAEIVAVNTSADCCIDDHLCIGFDGNDAQALPTVLVLLDFRTQPDGRAAALAHHVLGDVVCCRRRSWLQSVADSETSN